MNVIVNQNASADISGKGRTNGNVNENGPRTVSEGGRAICACRECATVLPQGDKKLYCCPKCQTREQNIRQGRVKSVSIKERNAEKQRMEVIRGDPSISMPRRRRRGARNNVHSDAEAESDDGMEIGGGAKLEKRKRKREKSGAVSGEKEEKSEYRDSDFGKVSNKKKKKRVE